MSFLERGLNPPMSRPSRPLVGRPVSSKHEARALMKAAGIDRCEGCGWRLPDCCRAGDRSELLEIHHIHPTAAGGRDETGNLVLLCLNCHKVAHRLFPLRKGVYQGPIGRGDFLIELRLFWVDPDHWWAYRRETARARVSGPWNRPAASGIASGK